MTLKNKPLAIIGMPMLSGNSMMVSEPQPDKSWINTIRVDKTIEKDTILIVQGNETTPLIANGDGTVREWTEADGGTHITAERIKEVLEMLEANSNSRPDDTYQIINSYKDLPELKYHDPLYFEHESSRTKGASGFSGHYQLKSRNGTTKKYVKRKKAKNGRSNKKRK